MNESYYLVLLVGMVVFAGAGAIKGFAALRAGEPYRFSWWEGLLFRGKMLTRNATQLKAILSSAVVVGSVLALAGARSPGFEIAIGGLCIMIISDLAGRKDAP